MNLENLGLVELNAQEVQGTEGGFVPLVILGVTYAAPVVAGWICGAFAAGVGIGVTCYLTGR
jgi:hypothetical protein